MQQRREQKYLILSEDQLPIARAVLESREDAPTLQVRVLDERIDEVLTHESIQLVGMSEGTKSVYGKIVRARGDRILVESTGVEIDVRENLRVPTQFLGFIYPLSGAWRGRSAIRAHNLSCGGIAFFSGVPLEIGEEIEMVVPVTTTPVILKAQVLRQNDNGMYAAKFIDVIHDEEVLVREAVFAIQLRVMGRRDRRSDTGKGTRAR